MAIFRRNRRLVLLLTVGISALVFLYFADIQLLHRATPFSHLVAAPLEKMLADDRRHDDNASGQCKKLTIEPPEVDIKTHDLYYEFFGHSNNIYPRWSSENQYNESKVKTEPKLKVFVVPHSHVDPGWLKTVDEYSTDTNKMLNNMIKYMPKNPAMTFTWMEISFFEIWWRDLNDEGKEITKKLIKDGRFQITSGSWTMTDEATPYYWATIDNIVEGHQFLKRELDMVPSVMWSNDPFGYGPTVPYLFRLANVDRAVLQRIHSTIKTHFGQRKAMDFYYRQFFDSSGEYDSHVHLLPYVHYDVPNTCGPSSGICCMYDFKRITHYFCGGQAVEPITRDNVVKRAEELKEQYRQMAQIYKHNVLLVMLGDDFRYEMMEEWSQQHDNYVQLMDYMNRRPEWNIEARFGTFNDFFKALDERRKAGEAENKERARFPLLSGDFFPYNDVGDNYWVGYYTTRPFYKRQDRVVQAMIRAADIASSLVYFSGRGKELLSRWYEKMRLAHRNLAIFQHHDAITGTSKWHVVTDYGQRLQQALINAAKVASEATAVLAGGVDGTELKWSQKMPLYNQTVMDEVIELNDGQEKKLWMFNPLPHQRSELVRYRVKAGGCYFVKDSVGQMVNAQLNPILGMNGIQSDQLDLLFEAKLPPLAAVQYSLAYVDAVKIGCAEFPKVLVGGSKASELKFPKQFVVENLPQSDGKRLIKLENNLITSYHSSSTGYLQAIKTKAPTGDPENVQWNGQIEFWFYNETRSGAYIFDPTSPAKKWPYEPTTVVVIHGTVTDEVHSIANSIYHKEYLRKFSVNSEPASQILIENTLDIRSQHNVEVVMRIVNSDIVSHNNTFLTDSLGLQLMPRRYLTNQQIHKSYYPMSSQLVLQNDDQRLTLLSGQPHGATSPVPGWLEIMLDRILIVDDMKGLGSDSLIRDNVPVTSVFRLILERGDFIDSRVLSLSSQRSLQNLLYPPVTFLQTEKPKATLVPFVPLQESFPCGVLLVNIRPLDKGPDGKRKHLLLLHRLLSDCRAHDDTSCQGSSRKALPKLLSNLLKNAQAQDCSLSGIQSSASSESSLSEFMQAHPFSKPMEIRSVCIA